MIVHHETPYSRVLIAEKPLSGVAIQSGSTSSTLLPVCSHVDGAGGVAVWDMPGSQDTRGPFVELIVHKIYEWMLANGKTLRFVLVSPPPTERPQRAALEKTINSPFISQENATIVYTKCSREFDPQSTAGLEISEEKRDIQSFAMCEPRRVDREGHDYSLEHSDLRLAVLKTLEQLRSSATTFNGSLLPAAQLLQNEIRDSSVVSAREKVSTCFLKDVEEFNQGNLRGTIADLREVLKKLSNVDELSFGDVLKMLARMTWVAVCPFRLEADADTAKALAKAKRRLDLLFPTQVLRRIPDWLSAKSISTLENVKRVIAVLICRVDCYS